MARITSCWHRTCSFRAAVLHIRPSNWFPSDHITVLTVGFISPLIAAPLLSWEIEISPHCHVFFPSPLKDWPSSDSQAAPSLLGESTRCSSGSPRIASGLAVSGEPHSLVASVGKHLRGSKELCDTNFSSAHLDPLWIGWCNYYYEFCFKGNISFHWHFNPVNPTTTKMSYFLIKVTKFTKKQHYYYYYYYW